MKLKRESELKKMIDDFGDLCKKKHKFHNTEVLLTNIEVDSVEVIVPYGEGFTKESYKMSESNQFLKPFNAEIIDTMHRNYSNIKAQYNSLFNTDNIFN